MNLKKITLFLLLLLLKGSTAIAADRFSHELFGSLNMLSASVAPVSLENNRWGLGFGGGVGYSCHFTSYLSLRTGLHANVYRSTAGMSGYENVSNETFPDEWGWFENPAEVVDNTFELTSTLDEYVALQSALYLQLPLVAEFEGTFRSLKYLGWYASGGMKLGYAVSGSSNVDIKGLSTKVYLGQEKVGDIKAPPHVGFGLEGVNENVKAKLELGFQAVGYLEAGFKQLLTDRATLYAGFFGEYCVYNVVGSNASAVLDYTPLPVPANGEATPYRFRFNPAANVKGSSVKMQYPLSFGITVRIGFTFSKKLRERNDQLFNVRYFQF
ncbi:MAG: outer membrane beta-barrel protein [Prevotellaceae bacterium]|jgi:hypothetical protein|nr:outer membrane beta-barrel protein [Prevotellaceae bacterium]